MKKIRVETKEGILAGEDCGQVMVFRGVPYAEAPVGGMRFAAPASRRSWTGEREALQFAQICPQPDPHGGFYGKEFYDDPAYPVPQMSEDCLYLNVWAPKEGENCPVAVWIHGGAFDHGWSSEMEFDGMSFARSGVVFVSINYRVGVFGFMADPQLARENPHGSTGNYGMLDQIEALKWVHRNIGAFHGDPSRVTVFGQSAGAMSVQSLLCSPLARGLISQAIMQSAAGYGNGLCRTRTMEQACRTGKMIMDLCGAKDIEELRKVPQEKLVEILPALYSRVSGLAFGPVADQYVLLDTTDGVCRSGGFPDMPMMIGMTGNDITVAEGMDGRKSPLFRGMCDLAAVCRGHRSPVYLYYFDRHLPGDDAGAFHSSELWYVFETLDRCWRPMERHDYQLSRSMSEAWQKFISTGDPGWKAYTPENGFVRTWM